MSYREMVIATSLGSLSDSDSNMEISSNFCVSGEIPILVIDGAPPQLGKKAVGLTSPAEDGFGRTSLPHVNDVGVQKERHGVGGNEVCRPKKRQRTRIKKTEIDNSLLPQHDFPDTYVRGAKNSKI
ncbi:hypothetical protein ZOSMA_160G00100 [Zostera marina]|uniref:Uncharacterized protein n=1 Tax=Zostera marina TaxID=29655 RepID=A0A0K9PUH9_ZOSMR|nr:hypothetical protein ZOSMA_160G00100 [Zostera marina]